MDEWLSAKDQDNFFPEFYRKSQVLDTRLKKVRDAREVNYLLVTDSFNLENASIKFDLGGLPEISVQAILNGSDISGLSNIIFLTNNSLKLFAAPGVDTQAIRNSWASTLFVCHDFDNHHWYEMSLFCQEFSDFYFPAHPSGCGWTQVGPSYTGRFIAAGTVQWPRSMLQEFSESDIYLERFDRPLGKHHFYPKFKFRNQIIKTFSDFFPDIAFVDSQSFHRLTPFQKLREWAAHKVHLIIPVRGDIPNRFFDALVTGGLPIVPSEVSSSLDYYKVPDYLYLSFNTSDLVDPKEIINRGVRRFDQLGVEGVLARHRFALEHFHVLRSVTSMKDFVDTAIKFRRDT